MVQGKGDNLAPPIPELTLPVTVQLLVDDGTTLQCWQTTFAEARENDAGRFKAKGP